jgi:hypothetical protein
MHPLLPFHEETKGEREAKRCFLSENEVHRRGRCERQEETKFSVIPSLLLYIKKKDFFTPILSGLSVCDETSSDEIFFLIFWMFLPISERRKKLFFSIEYIALVMH